MVSISDANLVQNYKKDFISCYNYLRSCYILIINTKKRCKKAKSVASPDATLFKNTKTMYT